ncbi:hypothetical protein [Luteolibacter luteus]|uniref:Uncharacterized protein n=1 Tax=Luteolibacter luteus TaxID=2728835 RepID=A0A858RJZ5_9BACT|nr:hypothetical protein [Luteolibacter luteus]QJE97182.1 hypothetical protein HHL09_15775 [Luteolibacter luteus]
MSNDFEQLWRTVLGGRRHGKYFVHGPDHWRRVERHGLLEAANLEGYR